MPVVDIAQETQKVGNALTSVRIDQMILNLAKGIAWGQYDLDKVGVDITKMMGAPGTVNIGGEQISMLEAGFLPSFYHFVDTILEIKMEVNIREEQSSSRGFKETMQRSFETEAGAEVGFKAKASFFLGSAEVSAKAHWKTRSTSAYSRTVDAKHSQSFSQDLSATSLMRTKIVPVPPPELLVERVKILLERLREDAEVEEAEQGFLFQVPEGDLVAALDQQQVPADLSAAFKDNQAELTDPTVSKVAEGSWTIRDGETKYEVKRRNGKLRVYGEVPDEERKSLDEILMGKVEDELLERQQKIAERIAG